MQALPGWAQQAAPHVDYWSVRHVRESAQALSVRQNVAEAPVRSRSEGLMVSVVDAGAQGFAATGDVSPDGLRAAFAQALALARASARHALFDYRQGLPAPAQNAVYRSPNLRPVAAQGLGERFDMLRAVCASVRVSGDIVDWRASLWTTHTEQTLCDARGALVTQQWDYLVPNIVAIASVAGVTQTRTAAGQYNGFCQQGGLEVLERSGFLTDGARIGHEALALATAPNCPSGDLDIVLMPDQMMLQIHESIGHPLELDRILGDERNYAGTSFVTPDMFGSYQYGSPLLNVTYDPTRPEQFASFAYDDEGMAAERAYIIQGGLLLRPLGAALSQARAAALGLDLPAVATSRACAWNRAPIDRMSNLNVEPGATSLEAMIAGVDDGLLLRTNASWSIDDSRNKFQFGCELGQRIRHGRLAEVVKNPNYRGISSTFWRALAAVGDAASVQVMGTPYCGKGEPNQVVRVGHAAPPCLFRGVAVFGGAA